MMTQERSDKILYLWDIDSNTVLRTKDVRDVSNSERRLLAPFLDLATEWGYRNESTDPNFEEHVHIKSYYKFLTSYTDILFRVLEQKLDAHFCDVYDKIDDIIAFSSDLLDGGKDTLSDISVFLGRFIDPRFDKMMRMASLNCSNTSITFTAIVLAARSLLMMRYFMFNLARHLFIRIKKSF